MRPPSDRPAPASKATNGTPIYTQIAALPALPMKDLWKLWDAHFPRRPGTWNRDYVQSRVAYKIQEAAYGGIDPNIRQKLIRLGESQSAFGKRRGTEIHLMPGTVLCASSTPKNTVSPSRRQASTIWTARCSRACRRWPATSPAASGLGRRSSA